MLGVKQVGGRMVQGVSTGSAIRPVGSKPGAPALGKLLDLSVLQFSKM